MRYDKISFVLNDYEGVFNVLFGRIGHHGILIMVLS